MKKNKIIVAVITAVLIFTVGSLFAIAYIREFNTFNNFKDNIPQDVFIKHKNKLSQLILNFFMVGIGGSFLSFSIIHRGIYFVNGRYAKIYNIIGMVVVFIVNTLVEFKGIWCIFTAAAIIITFDCFLIFIKEEYDSFVAKKRVNKSE